MRERDTDAAESRLRAKPKSRSVLVSPRYQQVSYTESPFFEALFQTAQSRKGGSGFILGGQSSQSV